MRAVNRVENVEILGRGKATTRSARGRGAMSSPPPAAAASSEANTMMTPPRGGAASAVDASNLVSPTAILATPVGHVKSPSGGEVVPATPEDVPLPQAPLS